MSYRDLVGYLEFFVVFIIFWVVSGSGVVCSFVELIGCRRWGVRGLVVFYFYREYVVSFRIRVAFCGKFFMRFLEGWEGVFKVFGFYSSFWFGIVIV